MVAEDLNLSVCINATPSLSSLALDGVLTYASPNYVARTYAFDSAAMAFAASCTLENGQRFRFYTVSNATSYGATDVTFTILQGGAALEDALLRIQSFLNATSTWVTVASQLTDSNGEAQLALELCPTYYKFVVSQDGTVLYESASPEYLKDSTHTIEVGTEVPEFYNVYGDITSSCSYVESGDYFRCSLSDSSGKTQVATLNVYSSLSTTAICTTSESSSSTTLICDMSAQGSGDYRFVLQATTSSDTFTVNSGGFTKGSQTTLTPDGPVVGFAILLSVLFASRFPPVLMIALSTFVFLAILGLKVASASYVTTGWLLVMAGVGIFRVIQWLK